MNKEIKEEWVKALRSGAYEQGRGYLKNGDKYCCLGVLCDVVGNFGKNLCVLSPDLVELTGLSCEGHLNTEIEVNGEKYDSLTSLNDEAGMSFEEIANVIEEYL